MKQVCHFSLLTACVDTANVDFVQLENLTVVSSAAAGVSKPWNQSEALGITGRGRHLLEKDDAASAQASHQVCFFWKSLLTLI